MRHFSENDSCMEFEPPLAQQERKKSLFFSNNYTKILLQVPGNKDNVPTVNHPSVEVLYGIHVFTDSIFCTLEIAVIVNTVVLYHFWFNITPIVCVPQHYVLFLFDCGRMLVPPCCV